MSKEFLSKDLKSLFGKRYEIPEFQRPYSWEIHQCDKLWQDLIAAFEERNNDNAEKYFLGVVIVYKSSKEDKYCIVDGQQRITSLLLLLKAFYLYFPKKSIDRLIHVYDSVNEDEKLENELRLTSFVSSPGKEKDQDLYQLREILNATDENKVRSWETEKDSNRFQKNCSFFLNKITEWKQEQQQDIESVINEFLNFIFSRVEFCFMTTGNNVDTALRLFGTLNDRGMPLNDGDIIKSWIYRELEDSEKDDFLEYWNSLTDGFRYDVLKRYSFIYQVQESKEKSLRAFFETEILPVKGGSAQKFLERMKHMALVYEYINEDKEICYWHNVIHCFGIESLQYPLLAFIYGHGKVDENAKALIFEKHDEAVNLLKDTLRFVAVRILQPRTGLSAIYTLVRKVCRAVVAKEAVSWDVAGIEQPSKEDFINSVMWPKYLKGFLALYHVLNPKQDHAVKDLSNNYHIEHILPRKWQNYDGWNSDLYKYYIWYFGNLTLLEKKSNIRAQNEYFVRKKDEYKKSSLQDVKEGLISYDKWTKDEVEHRFHEMSERLYNFISGKN